MTAFADFLLAELRNIDAANQRRTLRTIAPAQGVSVGRGGRSLLNFSSNDYLGLATHPIVTSAAAAALDRAGAGSGASRLVSGTLPEHEELEEALARFKRTAAALAFSSGYAAALGTIPALVGAADIVIMDKLCHACLIDGAQLSGATIRVFPHNDLNALEKRLASARAHNPRARILILAESVYSMDGDTAPLAELVALKERFGAWLLLDEAHAVGVLGDRGRGLADAAAGPIEIQMGTLGKALGSSGAYVCGAPELREFLINKARSFIFSTAPNPAAAAAATAAVRILDDSPLGPELLRALQKNRDEAARRLRLPSPPAAIIPIILGTETKALAAAAHLEDRGLLVPAIRFPTVPRGTARLRIAISAAHSADHIRQLAEGIQTLPGET